MAPAAAVQRVASLREPRTTIGGVNLVAGFRPELWAAVAPGAAPEGVSGFREPLVGPTGVTLPATQHDVVFWLTGASYDVIFDLSRSVVVALAGVARVAHELVGWPYHHDRDLTGFEDGTENPTLVEAASVAVIPPGRPGEGSSILLLQQWEHDAIAWEQLPVVAQEAIIGRRRGDGAELDPEPPTSHVARTDQDSFGRIFRRNIPYGTLTSHGTIFVGFSADQRILDAMLRSMVGTGGQPPDALTTVTRALTGAYYVVPSIDALSALGGDDRAGGLTGYHMRQSAPGCFSDAGRARARPLPLEAVEDEVEPEGELDVVVATAEAALVAGGERDGGHRRVDCRRARAPWPRRRPGRPPTCRRTGPGRSRARGSRGRASRGGRGPR